MSVPIPPSAPTLQTTSQPSKSVYTSKMMILGAIQIAVSILSILNVIPPDVMSPKVALYLGPSGVITMILRAVTTMPVSLKGDN